MFDEQKLRHMNGQHLRALNVDQLTERLETFTGRTGLKEAVAISRGRSLACYEVTITDDAGRRICTGRLTCMLIDTPPQA